MAKQKILLVGDNATIKLWQGQLMGRGGYDCEIAQSAWEALRILRGDQKWKDGEALITGDSPQVLVLDSVALAPPTDSPNDLVDPVKSMFAHVTNPGDMGAALIKQIRDEMLISIDTPAFLATRNPAIKYPVEPEGVTRVVGLGAIFDQIQPALQRAGGSGSRGRE